MRMSWTLWTLSMLFLRQCWMQRGWKQDGLFWQEYLDLRRQTDFMMEMEKRLPSFIREHIRTVLFIPIRILQPVLN